MENYTFIEKSPLSWGPQPNKNDDCVLIKNLIFAIIGYLLLISAIFVKIFRSFSANKSNKMIDLNFSAEIDKIKELTKFQSVTRNSRPDNTSTPLRFNRTNSAEDLIIEFREGAEGFRQEPI